MADEEEADTETVRIREKSFVCGFLDGIVGYIDDCITSFYGFNISSLSLILLVLLNFF